MNRKEFLKVCSYFGLSIPLLDTLNTSDTFKKDNLGNNRKIIIIGAGAAGMSAGYLLKQKDIDFKILEANFTYGGRMKKSDDFADFPLPLGAEWLSTKPSILKKIVNDDTVKIDVSTVKYHKKDPYGKWKKGKLKLRKSGTDKDRKFIGTTWLGFFENYLIPSIAQDIHYENIVEAIDYSGDKVAVVTQHKTYIADQVIVTIPVKMMQKESVEFIPKLPVEQLVAIQSVTVWEGIKVFIEFSKKFYPTFTDFKIKPKNLGQVVYYDATYGQDSKRNILGLFAVGKPALQYINRDGEELKSYILNELDEIFSGQASRYYVKHLVKNWTKEPFIEGTYVNDYENYKIVGALSKPIDDKIYFAGEAYTNGNDWGFVHTAIKSAMQAIKDISKEIS